MHDRFHSNSKAVAQCCITVMVLVAVFVDNAHNRRNTGIWATPDVLLLASYMNSERQRGQLEEWLVLNHLYRQEEWKRFLQVLHGFRGRDPSERLMME